MRTLITTILAIAMTAGVAHAQARRGTTPADSLLVRANIFRDLFEGTTLTPEQTARAKRIIAVVDRQQMALWPLNSCQRWTKTLLLQKQRDSVLRVMLVTDSAKARFDKKAAAAYPDHVTLCEHEGEGRSR